MSGKLFIVATPIGNLKDITFRAVETLKSVDVIAAEDTRRAKELLNALDIHGKKIISYHEHNEEKVTEKIIELLKEGKDVSLISDAGTPTISDPGYKIVKRAREENIIVTPLPGPSAVIAALSASGFPTDKFLFIGFLPKKKKKRKETLEEIVSLPYTVIAYESPHRIEETLKDLAEIAPQKKLAVYREITKLYETFSKGNPDELLKTVVPKGEFVLIFPPSKKEKKENPEKLIKEFKEKGLSLKESVEKTCRITELKKNEIYKKALQIYKE